MVKLKIDVETTVKDRGANAILKQISSIGRESSVTVGVHEPQSTQLAKDKTGVSVGTLTIGQYAKINEYGADKIPARPALRQTLDRHADQFVKQTARLQYKLPLKELLAKQGDRAVRWTKATIRRGDFVANSPLTIMYKRRKGRGTRPLIFTGSYLNSISYKVRMARLPNRKLARMLEKAEASLRRVRP